MAGKNLVMSFMNDKGKKVSLKLSGVRDNVTNADVSKVMDTILAKNIFDTSGGDLKVKDSAELVDKTTSKMTVR